MPVRLSLQQAQRLGIIPPAARCSAREKQHKRDPQRILHDALCRRLPDEAIQYEAQGLIPGRRFRADIWIPRSRIAVEMDGFQYHRSKAAFQADRERQNLFAAQGITVLRYFARQVFRDLDSVIEQIAKVHQRRVTNTTTPDQAHA